MLSVIFVWEYNFLLGPVAQSEASPVVHLGFVSFIATLLKSTITWRLVMKTNIRSFTNFRWFNKGSCQFQVKVCAKSTVLYPYFTQGPNPTNWQILQLTYEDHSFWNWCPRSMDGPFFITVVRENLANHHELPRISVNSCPIRAAFGIFSTNSWSIL